MFEKRASRKLLICEIDDIAAHCEDLDQRLAALAGAPPADPIAEARAIMREALADPGRHLAYLANVGMLLHDELETRGYKPKLRSHDRTEVSQKVLDLLFLDPKSGDLQVGEGDPPE